MIRFQVVVVTLLPLVFLGLATKAEETELVDPNSIQLGPIIHESLPDELLKRIRRISNTFEIVDGISYEQSVDLYKRDYNPEANIRIFEEMARVYENFCEGRCSTHAERMDVYRIVLLCSMFPKKEVLNQIELQVITKTEANSIISRYGMAPEPIRVFEQ